MKALLTLFMVISSSYYVFTIMDGNTSLKFDLPESSVESSTPEEQTANVYIKGLNSYDAASLEIIKETIEKFGFSCKIDNPIQTSYNGMLCSEYQNELGNDLYFDYDDDNPITIYVTDTELVDQNIRVSGLCYGNSIYIDTNPTLIKETVIHELLHSFGLKHCENKCVMSISSGVWDYNTDKPIFCDDCKSKAPSQFLN